MSATYFAAIDQVELDQAVSTDGLEPTSLALLACCLASLALWRWPQDVQLNGQPVPVSARANAPAIFVAPGTHTVTGVFVWDSLPQALAVPATTGLVALSLEGQSVEFPELDQAGQLWLRRGGTEQGQAEDSLELKVYRRITDDIPLMVTMNLVLQVSGTQREVVLGPVITSDFVPMALTRPKATTRAGPGWNYGTAVCSSWLTVAWRACVAPCLRLVGSMIFTG